MNYTYNNLESLLLPLLKKLNNLVETENIDLPTKLRKFFNEPTYYQNLFDIFKPSLDYKNLSLYKETMFKIMITNFLISYYYVNSISATDQADTNLLNRIYSKEINTINDLSDQEINVLSNDVLMYMSMPFVNKQTAMKTIDLKKYNYYLREFNPNYNSTFLEFKNTVPTKRELVFKDILEIILYSLNKTNIYTEHKNIFKAVFDDNENYKIKKLFKSIFLSETRKISTTHNLSQEDLISELISYCFEQEMLALSPHERKEALNNKDSYHSLIAQIPKNEIIQYFKDDTDFMTNFLKTFLYYFDNEHVPEEYRHNLNDFLDKKTIDKISELSMFKSNLDSSTDIYTITSDLLFDCITLLQANDKKEEILMYFLTNDSSFIDKWDHLSSEEAETLLENIDEFLENFVGEINNIYMINNEELEYYKQIMLLTLISTSHLVMNFKDESDYSIDINSFNHKNPVNFFENMESAFEIGEMIECFGNFYTLSATYRKDVLENNLTTTQKALKINPFLIFNINNHLTTVSPYERLIQDIEYLLECFDFDEPNINELTNELEEYALKNGYDEDSLISLIVQYVYENIYHEILDQQNSYYSESKFKTDQLIDSRSIDLINKIKNNENIKDLFYNDEEFREYVIIKFMTYADEECKYSLEDKRKQLLRTYYEDNNV